MHKCLSAKYYQENRKRLQKKLMKGIKIFLKRIKSNYMVINVTRISQKIKNKSSLSVEKKNILESEKMHNYKKLF